MLKIHVTFLRFTKISLSLSLQNPKDDDNDDDDRSITHTHTTKSKGFFYDFFPNLSLSHFSQLPLSQMKDETVNSKIEINDDVPIADRTSLSLSIYL